MNVHEGNFEAPFVVLTRDFCAKKEDASLQYFVYKFDGIVFFIQAIETVCELVYSANPYKNIL